MNGSLYMFLEIEFIFVKSFMIIYKSESVEV